MGENWIFGIDGGGTSSRLRIESLDGRLLWAGEGGSTNPQSNPKEAVAAVLARHFEVAYRATGLDPAGCAAGFLGSAGMDRPAERLLYPQVLREASGVTAPLAVGNDAEPSLAGALGTGEGMLVIAGTGSIGYGRARDGRTWRVGGWGHLLGDEGSAFRVAFDGIARAIRSSEGRDLPTGLLEKALAFFSLKTPPDLIPFVYSGLDKSAIARFASVVGEARDSGDELARDIFGEAAREIVGLARALHARMVGASVPARLSFRGGLIENDRGFRDAVLDGMKRDLAHIEVVEAKADAAIGACILARELASPAGASS